MSSRAPTFAPTPESPAARAHRIEHAQADQNRAFIATLARLQPESGASSLRVAGGWANFAGVGSPLTQAVALGLDGPVSEADLDALERHLGRGGGPVQVEVCPYADKGLLALLARRGYCITEFQQVWAQPAPTEPLPRLPGEVHVRRMAPEEAALFTHVVVKGFMDGAEPPPEMEAHFHPTTLMENSECYLAWLGDTPIGGGCLGFHDGVATLSGTSVLPAFRKHGGQSALIRARLERARERGCDVVTSSTLAGTASQANMERQGFRVLYPKVMLVRQP